MKIESVPIDSIHLDPANVRSHPERNLATIKASLARFGQQKHCTGYVDMLQCKNGIISDMQAV